MQFETGSDIFLLMKLNIKRTKFILKNLISSKIYLILNNNYLYVHWFFIKLIIIENYLIKVTWGEAKIMWVYVLKSLRSRFLFKKSSKSNIHLSRRPTCDFPYNLLPSMRYCTCALSCCMYPSVPHSQLYCSSCHTSLYIYNRPLTYQDVSKYHPLFW